MARLESESRTPVKASTARSSMRSTKRVKMVKDRATAKFDETIEVAMNLGVDPRHADQMVRGVVNLPNGTGKTVRVAVFAKDAKADEASEAGADIVGADDLVEQIQAGKINFDRCIATPDMMPLVGRLGKILGPRNLMPNPKVGTVTPDVAGAVKAAKGGAVEFRVEKAGILHAGVGKASFTEEALLENIKAFTDAVQQGQAGGRQGHLYQARRDFLDHGPRRPRRSRSRSTKTDRSFSRSVQQDRLKDFGRSRPPGRPEESFGFRKGRPVRDCRRWRIACRLNRTKPAIDGVKTGTEFGPAGPRSFRFEPGQLPHPSDAVPVDRHSTVVPVVGLFGDGSSNWQRSGSRQRRRANMWREAVDRAEKAELVASLTEAFKASGAIVVAHYAGLTVADMETLRVQMKQAGGQVKVAKNRLAKLALKDTDNADISALFTGPTVVAYSEDPITAPKIAVQFADKNQKFVVLGGAMGATELDPDRVKALADVALAGRTAREARRPAHAARGQDRIRPAGTWRPDCAGSRRLCGQGRCSIARFAALSHFELKPN